MPAGEYSPRARAGKTTLNRILSGQLYPTKGKASVLGYDVNTEYNELKRYISYLPQDFRPSYYTLTARDYIFSYLLMREYSISDAKQNTRKIIHDLEIEEVAETKISKLSGGCMKRVSLGMTLAIDDSFIYFLDEPYAGLDVRSRVNLWGQLRNICKEKKTILISSHYLEDIQTIARMRASRS